MPLPPLLQLCCDGGDRRTGLGGLVVVFANQASEAEGVLQGLIGSLAQERSPRFAAGKDY